jgi:hypothetical protein
MGTRTLIGAAFFVAALLLSGIGQAKQDKSAAVGQSGPVRVGDASTALEVDTEAHVIRVMIEGREVAVFAADGLHVKEFFQGGGVANIPAPRAQP